MLKKYILLVKVAVAVVNGVNGTKSGGSTQIVSSFLKNSEPDV